ncbi:unnamed protein product [Ilex paraguariensis]|uniref:Uncharacterized protein n=1 Tax=Ilex paraguariensis TaxID=185542 RepID=A0ABC8U7T7_9AQUA
MLVAYNPHGVKKIAGTESVAAASSYLVEMAACLDALWWAVREGWTSWCGIRHSATSTRSPGTTSSG